MIDNLPPQYVEVTTGNTILVAPAKKAELIVRRIARSDIYDSVTCNGRTV